MFTTYSNDLTLYSAKEYYEKRGLKFGKPGRGFMTLEAFNKPLPDGTPRTAVSSIIVINWKELISFFTRNIRDIYHADIHADVSNIFGLLAVH